MPHTRAWDETDPDDLDEARFYAQKLREAKADIRERLEVDHDFDDQVTGGQHKKVTFIEGADPAAEGDRIILYGKDVDGITELFARDSAGNIVRLTVGGTGGGGGHSATEAEMKITADPGVSGAVSLAAIQNEELDRIRRVIRRIALGDTPKLTSGAVEAGWFDGVAIGESVTRNGAFLGGSVDDSIAPSPANPPFGWTVVGSPTVLSRVALDVSEGDGQAVHIIGAVGTGISQTLTGLRASSLYLIVCRIKSHVLDWKLKTTGAPAGVFDDLDLTSVSGSSVWQTLSGIIATDAVPTNIVVSLISATNGAACHTCLIDAIPLGKDKVDRQRPFRRSRIANTDVVATLEADTTIDVVVPGPGYSINVHGNVVLLSNGQSLVEIERSIDGGAFSVVIDSPVTSGALTLPIPISWPEESPIIGAVYRFRLSLTVVSGTTALRNSNHQISVELVKN